MDAAVAPDDELPPSTFPRRMAELL